MLCPPHLASLFGALSPVLLLGRFSAWLPLDAASSNSNSVRFVSFETYGDDGNAWNAWFRPEQQDDDDKASEFARKPQGQVCCHVLRRALIERNDDSIAARTGGATPDSVLEKCQAEITPFHGSSSSFLNAKGLPHLPLSYAFFFWPDSNDAELAKTAKKSNSGLFPPPVPMLPSASQRFVWDDRNGRWLLPSKTLQDVVNDDDAKAALDWIMRKEEKIFDENRWSVHLESGLSESGGMHRDLRHRITVETASSSIKENHNSSATAKVAMIMSLHIPSDMFVNVEDLFRFETPGISAELLPMDNVTIDQEEPAFVSPPHGLLVLITVAQSAAAAAIAAAATLTFEFVTMLHVRYPLPFSNNETAAFRLVVLPPPRLLIATLVWNDRDLHSDVVYEEVGILFTPSKSAQQQQRQIQGRLLSLWVAAGHQADYPFTLGITLFTAVIGAIIMLRDISRVARWD